jgi:hypothetical protein
VSPAAPGRASGRHPGAPGVEPPEAGGELGPGLPHGVGFAETRVAQGCLDVLECGVEGGGEHLVAQTGEDHHHGRGASALLGRVEAREHGGDAAHHLGQVLRLHGLRTHDGHELERVPQALDHVVLVDDGQLVVGPRPSQGLR